MDTHVDLPAVVLVVMLLAMWRMLVKVQKRPDVDMIDILRNADGKLSWLNTGGVGAFAISSWVLMHDALANTVSDQQWWAYLLIWSGAPVSNAIVNKWDGALPWSRKQ
jgi:hypothetical protein